ncbi:MAG: polysaccharide biosynthesis C-terminal domain-containing protein, partial [Oscillospiraceae bacterium]|nr:polysaccharide biosynthesis C-terminal domain-containing protein [Oscillospiraceae bacterium]
MVMAVAVPIMIQNGITNFVGLLDNIMVGLIGTEQMSGVAIANQLIFIFNLCIFGALSGAGIFGAQFYGKGDHEGVRYSFRFKLFISIALCAVATAVFSLFGSQLISLYLSENDAPELIAATLKHGKNYLVVMIFGLLPFALSQVYSGTLRECGETMLPMKAGIIAVFINLVLNYVFIFGKLGFPAMGGV